MFTRLALLALVVIAGALPARAHAFAIFRGFGATPQETLQLAARWSSTTGLDDGIQVAVEPGLAAALAAPGEDAALVEQAVLAGLNAWEVDSPVLDIDVLLDTPGSFEVNLFARPDSDPVFSENAFFGFADPRTRLDAIRPLTNGQSFRGFVIYHADVYLNIDQLQALVPLGLELRRDVITRVTMHEFGHALGLGHPNANNPFGAETNYDSDGDPLNRMEIDPRDPFAGIRVSAPSDDQAILSNAPCGVPPTLCDAASFTALRNDDLSGRDVLYPVPEPATALLVGLGSLALGAFGRRRRATPPPGGRPRRCCRTSGTAPQPSLARIGSESAPPSSATDDERHPLPAIGPEPAASGADTAVPLSQDPAKARGQGSPRGFCETRDRGHLGVSGFPPSSRGDSRARLKRVSALAPRPAMRAEGPCADPAGGTASARSR